jgi:hypothetical protein
MYAFPKYTKYVNIAVAKHTSITIPADGGWDTSFDSGSVTSDFMVMRG